MKLTAKDRELLLKWGVPECDLPQIEEALKSTKTKYSCNGKPISRDDAIDLLGREVYLSGISRSAFHFTAAREAAGKTLVLFDSSELFRDRSR